MKDNTLLTGAIVLGSLLLAAFGTVYVFHVGFIASDDGIYFGRALDLIGDEAFTLPEEHWGFRYPVVYPLAALLYVFGTGEAVITAVPILYYIAALVAIPLVVRHYFGNVPAVFGAALLLSSPLLAIEASIANVDTPEALFLFLSLILLFAAVGKQPGTVRNYLIASGLLCGIAMTCRETAYGFLLVYGLLFLRGAYFPRARYLWGGLGVGLVLLVEMGSYVAYGESPLYRLLTAARSHGTVGIETSDFGSGSGNISDNRLIGPLLALLVNQEFGLLFWLSPVAAIALLRSPRLTDRQRQLTRLLVFSAVVWFLWIGYSGAIRPLPRYFAYVAIVGIVLIAAWLSTMDRRWLRYGILAGLIASNYAMLSVENIHPRFAERAITAYALADGGERIAVGGTAGRRVPGYFQIEGLDPRRYINYDEALQPGDLYAYVEGWAATDDRLTETQRAAMRDGTAPLVHRIEPPVLLVGRFLRFVGADTLLPADFFHRLAIRNKPVRFYRLVADGASATPTG